ncbi:MAG: DUF2065 domain-containing protein, partial [Rhodospirillaceae bacterium]|nr:DUF2065 domain-containing protein [Rhodospirillaceae bacterium]
RQARRRRAPASGKTDELRVKELLLALCLDIVLEGMIYALFPNGMRRLLQAFLEASETTIRVTGLGAAAVGLGLIWLIR